MKRLHGHERLWSMYVDYAQLAINTKIAELTNTSPFALLLGRECNPIKDYTQDPPLEVDLQAWIGHQERIAAVVLPAIADRVLAAKDKQVARFNAMRRQLAPEAFPAGAQVMIRNVDRSSKFDDIYVGPYQIERRTRSGTYVLRAPSATFSIAACRLIRSSSFAACPCRARASNPSSRCAESLAIAVSQALMNISSIGRDMALKTKRGSPKRIF